MRLTTLSATDHDGFGLNRSKVINVIDSNTLEHDIVRKPRRTFRYHALAAAALGGVLFFTSAPADAQTRRQQDDFFYYTAQQREMRHRPRSRITVQRRSYLDPGPELIPGEYKYRDYAEPYGYSALADAVPNQTWNRNPLNGPFDVPGRPWPGRVDWW